MTPQEEFIVKYPSFDSFLTDLRRKPLANTDYVNSTAINAAKNLGTLLGENLESDLSAIRQGSSVSAEVEQRWRILYQKIFDEASPLLQAQLIESSATQKSTPPSEYVIEGPSDPKFIDDLIAANLFKSFLIGRGIEVPANVLLGLGTLSSEFRADVEMQTGGRQDALEGQRNRRPQVKGWWSRG